MANAEALAALETAMYLRCDELQKQVTILEDAISALNDQSAKLGMELRTRQKMLTALRQYFHAEKLHQEAEASCQKEAGCCSP